MRRNWGVVVTLIAIILLYGTGSVWLGAYWRAQGPMYRKMQERDGAIIRERLEKEGQNLIVEKQRDAGIEEARILNAARVDAAEIVARGKMTAAETEAIGGKTTDDLFLCPYLCAAGKAAELRTKLDNTQDAAKRRQLGLLIVELCTRTERRQPA